MFKFSRTAVSQRLCRFNLDDRQSDDRMVALGMGLCALAVAAILIFERITS
ncbi:hypothetical protein [Burkholderia phage BCSR129]|nr:hypothetical protein [Burkholderia phage BCSR129]